MDYHRKLLRNQVEAHIHRAQARKRRQDHAAAPPTAKSKRARTAGRTARRSAKRWTAHNGEWARIKTNLTIDSGGWKPFTTHIGEGTAPTAAREHTDTIQVAHLNCGQVSAIEVVRHIADNGVGTTIDVLHLQELWLTQSTARSLRNLVAETLPEYHLCLDHKQADNPQAPTLAIATLLRREVAQHTTRVPAELMAPHQATTTHTQDRTRGHLLVFCHTPPDQDAAIILINVYMPPVGGDEAKRNHLDTLLRQVMTQAQDEGAMVLLQGDLHATTCNRLAGY